MPSISTASISVPYYPNEYSSPYGNDEIVPLYSSVPLKSPVAGCLPCIVCGNSIVRNQVITQSSYNKGEEVKQVILTPIEKKLPSFSIGNPSDGQTVTLGYGSGYPSESCTYSVNFDPCQTSIGLTIKNNTDISVTLSVVGSVNDDVLFNGVVYQDGEFCFFAPGCTWDRRICYQGKGSQSNGAHSFNYSHVLASEDSILIQGQDNGYGGGIDCTITINF